MTVRIAPGLFSHQPSAADSQKIILPGDIPEGSEAALRLIRSKNLDKILDMVSYDARSTAYVQAMVKCFANISQLGVCAHEAFLCNLLGLARGQ